MQQPEPGQVTQEVTQLRQAFARQPGDLDLGLMLGSVLHGVKDYSGSALVLQDVLRQHPDHHQTLMLLARSLARMGKIAQALEILAQAQKHEPSSSQAWQVGAALAAQINDWPELLRIARHWTVFHPKEIAAWQALSRAHFEASRFREAILAFESVLSLEPKNPAHLVSAARLQIAAANYDSARNFLSAARELAPDSGELLYTLSRLYHMTGELVLAEEFCLRAIAALPQFAPAYVTLGVLREGRLKDHEIELISRLFHDPSTHPEYRAMLGFTLGDAFDRKGEFDAAFNFWDIANQINGEISEREGIRYIPEAFEEECRLLAALFAEPISLSISTQASPKVDPIFIIGMPRTGTTLIESVLASHSTVFGAGELPALYDIHEELMAELRAHGVAAARELIQTQAQVWRKRYFDALPPLGGALRVVDKQPLNFRSVGLIRVLFPDSKIIYTRRAAIDVGLSIYRHKFSKNWPCAHNLRDIGHYYGVHERICELWRQLYPGAMYIADHATLVSDKESEIRRLLMFAGLDFEAACLMPHKTKRPIATFSSVQVQQPVSAMYSNRAAPYISHLMPLSLALQKMGISNPEVL